MTYERVVSAALAETKSKFALAEALALDIPPRHPGPSDDEPVIVYLNLARQAIIGAGGEPRSIETLADYRKTAIWVQGVNTPNFRWMPARSFTAHSEARKAGMTYEAFVAMPKATIDIIRQQAGRAQPGTRWPAQQDAPQDFQDWTPQQQADAVKQAISDPVVADAVFNDPVSKGRAMTAIRRNDQHLPPAPPAPQPPSFTKLDVLVLLGDAKDAIRRAFKLAVSLGLAGDGDTLSDLGDVEAEADQFRKYLVGMSVDEVITKIMEGA